MTTQFDKAALSEVLQLARPALSKQSFVPVLSHFCFTGSEVVAYNDLSAVIVPLTTEFQGALPGELLIKAVTSLTGQTATLVEVEGEVLVSGGKSRFKLPKMATKDFIFTSARMLSGGVLSRITVNQTFLKGLERCLISVSNDPSHPAQMGVTFAATADTAWLYATDNHTISRASLEGVAHSVPADEFIILPTFFCDPQAMLLHFLDL